MNDTAMIGHREALTLMVTLMTCEVFLAMPRNMALVGASAGWLVVLLAGVLSFVGFFFLYRLIRKYPDQDIIQISKTLAGNWLGTLLGFVFFIFFLVSTSLLIRQFAESFILSILPRTPISVITIMFIALLVYGTIQGIETLSRVAWFFGPYLLLAFMVTILLALPYSELSLLLPILGKGPGPIFKEGVLQMSLFSNVILIGLLAPKIRNKDKIFGVGFFSLGIALIINMVVSATVIMTFNYASASRLIFPIFQLTRLITLGEFIQRVEAVFVFLWFFTAAIATGGLFYGAVISFSHTFNIKNHRPLVFAMALLIFTLSLIPGSMTETVELNNFIISRYYPMITFALPALLWLISLFKKKAGQKNE